MKQQRTDIIGLAVLVIMAGIFSLVLPVQADVTVQTVIGDVQFSLDGQQWTALTQGVSVQPGYMLQTGVGSEVIVRAEDGSVFYIREITQLKFIELTLTNDSRVYKAELLQGMLNVEVPFLPVEADNDLVQIITTLAIADATTSNDRLTSFQVTFEPSLPLFEMYTFSGIVTMRQIAAGASNIAGLFGGSEGSGKEGITFPVNRNGAMVVIEVQAEASTIIVKSILGIEELVAMIGDYMGMEATNLGEESNAPLTLFMPNGEDVLTLGKKGDKIFVATSPSSVVLMSAPNYLHSTFKFFRELGTFWVMGGGDSCDCGRATWDGGPGPGSRPERPVVPRPPSSPPPEAPGSPILP